MLNRGNWMSHCGIPRIDWWASLVFTEARYFDYRTSFCRPTYNETRGYWPLWRSQPSLGSLFRWRSLIQIDVIDQFALASHYWSFEVDSMINIIIPYSLSQYSNVFGVFSNDLIHEFTILNQRNLLTRIPAGHQITEIKFARQYMQVF
jgi:hypothetical protein